MKIIICPDSFKGSMCAQEVAQIIEENLKLKYPYLNTISIPLADGGEGTAQIIRKKYPYMVSLKAHNPIGRFITSKYYLDKNREKAFIESAEIIGLPLLSKEERNPLITSSYGLGEIIKNIIATRCKEITVSLGGSATCDGGKGMIEALEDIDYSDVKIKIICDVKNPLLGENGAVNVFAPQKGAKIEDLPELERRMEEFDTLTQKLGIASVSDKNREGSGAAGGLGYAFQTYLKADTFNGIEFIIKETEFEKAIENSDLIITGEGKIDSQSLMGKVLSGVLEKAKIKRIPVIAIGGLVEDKEILLESGLREIYEISNKALSFEENMKEKTAKENLKRCVNIMLKSNIFEQIKK